MKKSDGTFTFEKPNWNITPKVLLLVPLGILAVVGVLSSYYTVSPESVAVVQRFGRYVSTQEPGLHFKLPFGMDTATIVPVKRQLKLEFGFGTPGASNPDQIGTEPDAERDMVTGDLNTAQVEWIVQYTITSPSDFLFNLRDPAPTIRDLSESAMREVIGDRTVDEVLTIGRSGIEVEALAKLREMIELMQLGVSADQLQLMAVHPPRPVQRSFEEVNQAQQDRETLVNQANGEYNRVIPKARGEADQRISAAEGYALRRVNEAKGDVARFEELLAEYRKAPEITKQRLYLESMAEVLPKLKSKIILDEDAKQLLPLLNLGQ
ncbi:MAG: FtsH protease activity modulator HflK [Akkermansiaceae bacterium]|nr:FtsH protease activity modulator HflK [Akkermansiaceae bacterium]MCP5543467.1 FtsH protease activity modulator HflK [Akkermansiaceae bacterium]MCP5546808.1 FtsH protease activity modulator HflK [Akkermansiaceae bacterium]